MKKRHSIIIVSFLLAIILTGCNNSFSNGIAILYYTEDNNSLNYLNRLSKNGKNISFLSDKPSKAVYSLDEKYLYYLCYDSEYEENGASLYEIATSNFVSSKEIVPTFISDSVLEIVPDTLGGLYCFKYNYDLDMHTINYYYDGQETEILSGSWIDYEKWYCSTERDVMYVWCDDAWYRTVMSTNPNFQYVCQRDSSSTLGSLSDYCEAQCEMDYQTLVDNDMMIEIAWDEDKQLKNIVLYRNGVQNMKLIDIPAEVSPFGVDVVNGYPQFYFISTIDGQPASYLDKELGNVVFKDSQWSLFHYENNSFVECNEDFRFTDSWVDTENEIIDCRNCYVLNDEIITYVDEKIVCIKRCENGEYEMSSLDVLDIASNNYDIQFPVMDNQFVFILENKDGERFLIYEEYRGKDIYLINSSGCKVIAEDISQCKCFANDRKSVLSWLTSDDYSINYIDFSDLKRDSVSDSIKSVVGIENDLSDFQFCGNDKFLIEEVTGELYYCDSKNANLIDDKESSIVYSNGWSSVR